MAYGAVLYTCTYEEFQEIHFFHMFQCKREQIYTGSPGSLLIYWRIIQCKSRLPLGVINEALRHKDIWGSGGKASPFLTSPLDGGMSGRLFKLVDMTQFWLEWDCDSGHYFKIRLRVFVQLNANSENNYNKCYRGKVKQIFMLINLFRNLRFSE
jgi:hypothetical protein